MIPHEFLFSMQIYTQPTTVIDRAETLMLVRTRCGMPRHVRWGDSFATLGLAVLTMGEVVMGN